MEALRYCVALVLLVIIPPTLLFWFAIHPFVGFWRRVGLWKSYAVVLSAVALMMLVLFLAREHLLIGDFGTRFGTAVLGTCCLAGATAMRIAIQRKLGVWTVTGVPELRAEGAGQQRLVTDGIYARMRHPRYAQLWLAFLGLALIGNYLTTYILAALSVPLLYAVAILEEGELRDRFGEEYRDYCQRVPRFIPRFRVERQ